MSPKFKRLQKQKNMKYHDFFKKFMINYNSSLSLENIVHVLY